MTSSYSVLYFVKLVWGLSLSYGGFCFSLLQQILQKKLACKEKKGLDYIKSDSKLTSVGSSSSLLCLLSLLYELCWLAKNMVL